MEHAAPMEYSARRRNVILAAMCLAVVVVVSGVAMLNNALPAIAEDLRASQAQQQWITDAYAVALAALLLPFGALGDRFGRRTALVAGVIVFGAASGAAALAGSTNSLIVARVFMGIGAALIFPGTLSTITSVFPPEGRAKAVGLWAGFAGAGATLGMIASGALLETFAWPSVFVVTAILAAVTLGLVVAAVPSTKATEHVGLDPVGAVLSAVGIGLLVLGIIEGPERGWGAPIALVGILGGALALAGFVAYEHRASDPLLDPQLFRIRGFATGSASLFLQFFAMFGFFFVVLQYLQLVLGYGALKAAVSLLPLSAVILPLSTVAATLAEKHGQKKVGGAGLAISAVGFLAMTTLRADSGYLHFLWAMLIIGVGMALAMTPATNAIVASLPTAKQGVASAVNDTSRELGSAFGIAVLGSAFNMGYRGSIDSHLAGLPVDAAHGAHEAPAIAVVAARGLGDQGAALLDATRHAFISGMRYALFVGAALLVIGTLYVFFQAPSLAEEQAEDHLDEGIDLEHELDELQEAEAVEPVR
jgi:EmrB/QacA subfamily drug resistance transporter